MAGIFGDLLPPMQPPLQMQISDPMVLLRLLGMGSLPDESSYRSQAITNMRPSMNIEDNRGYDYANIQKQLDMARVLAAQARMREIQTRLDQTPFPQPLEK